MTELGNDFAARTAKSGIMEGMHVIDTTRQLFAGVLENGPSGARIDGSYKARHAMKEAARNVVRNARPTGFNSGRGGGSSNSGGGGGGGGPSPTTYAMEIGHTIYYTLESIPRDGGVLVFVPSYSMLNEMETEWEEQGLLRGFQLRRGAVVREWFFHATLVVIDNVYLV